MVHFCARFSLAIVVVVIAGSNICQVSAEVRHFKSPLGATGRRFACPSELLSYECEVNGRFLRWTFNSVYQTTFFFDDVVNFAQTVTDRYRVWAVLTGNQAPSGNSLDPAYRRLVSTLTLDSSQSLVENEDPHNISCSSDTTEQAMVTQIAMAGTPSMPQNVTVSPARRQASIDTMLIQWKPPCNIDRFDFVHYTISVFITELGSSFKYDLNGTSTEPEYYIHVPHQNIANIRLSIRAVSKCPQQVGLESDSVVVLNGGTPTPSHVDVSQDDSKTERTFKQSHSDSGFKENKPWSAGLVSAILIEVYCLL